MQTRNLECQLAMAQLKRYLSGAKLSDEALEALESHLVECPSCQLAVQAQRAGQTPRESPLTQAVVQTPAPTAAKTTFLKGHTKTLLLSLGLAAILIAMSMIANDPTKLFGERLAKPGASAPKPISSPAPKPVVASAEATRDEPINAGPMAPDTADGPAPNRVSAVAPLHNGPKPKTTPTSPTKRAIKPPPQRRVTSQKVSPKAQPKDNPDIQVYDPSGKPL